MMNARGAGPARAALSRAAKVQLGLKHGHVCVCVRGKARGLGKRRSLSLRPNVVCERPRRLGSRGRRGIRGGERLVRPREKRVLASDALVLPCRGGLGDG